MADFIRYVDERLDNSITSRTPSAHPVDSYQPLSFTDWLKYNDFLYTNSSDFLLRYQSYLNNWFNTTKTSQEQSEKIVQQYYTQLINEIVLNYSTIDEQRYLKNLDLSDPGDLALSVPFFTQKIKEICLYYSTLRDRAETATVQYNLKGSNFGTERTLYNLFINTLQTGDVTPTQQNYVVSVSGIKNNLTFETEDLYDNYADYYDVSSVKSASAYNSFNDLRAQYFTLNQYSIDPDLFKNISFSILRAIASYPFYLIELGSNLYVDPLINSTNLNYLKDSDFQTLISSTAYTDLNLYLQADLIKKYIGADIYYVKVGSTTTSYTSGILCKADNDFANYLNKRFPTVIGVPSTEYLLSEKELGLFFKPDKLGISTFTNFKFKPEIDYTKLEPNTLYFFPDPSKYGNISSNTKTSFKTPFDFIEDNTRDTVDFSNSYRFGDSTTDPYYQTFRAYQSREQTLDTQDFGLSKYTDAQDFFAGDQKTIWSNSDIYPVIPSNIFPIDLRTKNLLSLNKTLVQYKNDIYGNEFGLYKQISPNKANTFNYNATQSDNIVTCLALDNYTFKDPISGYNFDFTQENKALNWSGVILKTVTYEDTNLPIYNNEGKIISNETASFRLTGSTSPIYSYTFQPEIFCSDYSTVGYVCSIVDGVGFMLPGGEPYPATPLTDSTNYDPLNSKLYYMELFDAGQGHPYIVNNTIFTTLTTIPVSAIPNSPISEYIAVSAFFTAGTPQRLADYRATFPYPGNFLYTIPTSSYYVVDGFRFTVNGVDPCAAQSFSTTVYAEKSNFFDIRLPGFTTLVNETQSELNTTASLYDSKNTVLGDLYYRNSNSTVIVPVSTALSAIFLKYPQDIQEELNNSIINFDLYYDVLQLETPNYLVLEKLTFDYNTNTIYEGGPGTNYIYKDSNNDLQQISTVWFNEREKELLFCQMNVFNELSASNYKIIYPKIYAFNLNALSIKQIYPTVRDETLTYNYLSQYSLSGKDIELNIIKIDKPIMTYNDETNRYTITYLGKDASNAFYVFNSQFQYIDNIYTDVSHTMYKLGSDVYDINFANPGTSKYLQTYPILNTSVGSVVDNSFTFGTVA